MAKALVRNRFILEKYPGKGGWTYVVIPEILQDKKAPFGWVKVKGRIDDYELKNYRLMPMGKGRLFLPVKAEIRKKIGKQEGDWVEVVLYADHAALEIPAELLVCLQDDPHAFSLFKRFSEGEQKAYIDWISSAKTDKTRVERMAKTLDKISKGQKLHSK